MIELLLLQKMYKKLKSSGYFLDIAYYCDKQYSLEKIIKRILKLEEEFLEPYVINSDSKE